MKTESFPQSANYYKDNSLAQSVNELLTPWESNTYLTETTNELMIKVLLLVLPIFCVAIILQAYVTVFGPSNNYVGYIQRHFLA